MGEIKKPEPVLLMTAAFSRYDEAFAWGRETMQAAYGEMALESETFDFNDYTHYYDPTMGTGLKKRFWVFSNLIEPGELPEIKRLTNRQEEAFVREHAFPEKRPLNLDPGYVTLGKLVLASTKDHAHRIYLRDGIYAEVTLWWTKKQWKAYPWTFPDYASGIYFPFLRQCRELLYDKLRTGAEGDDADSEEYPHA
jgi:hypothetical protein